MDYLQNRKEKKKKKSVIVSFEKLDHVIFSFIFLHLILFSFTFVANARRAFISLFNNNIIMHRVKYDFSKKKIELLKVLLAKEVCTSTCSYKSPFCFFPRDSDLWFAKDLQQFLNFLLALILFFFSFSIKVKNLLGSEKKYFYKAIKFLFFCNWFEYGSQVLQG